MKWGCGIFSATCENMLRHAGSHRAYSYRLVTDLLQFKVTDTQWAWRIWLAAFIKTYCLVWYLFPKNMLHLAGNWFWWYTLGSFSFIFIPKKPTFLISFNQKSFISQRTCILLLYSSSHLTAVNAAVMGTLCWQFNELAKLFQPVVITASFLPLKWSTM